MRIRTPVDLGALIRERRKALRLYQKTLAEKSRREPPMDCRDAWILLRS